MCISPHIWPGLPKTSGRDTKRSESPNRTSLHDVEDVSFCTVRPRTKNGYGLGTDITLAYGMVLQALWSHRDGNNPNPAADGRDQDGTLDRNRIWLSLSLPLTL